MLDRRTSLLLGTINDLCGEGGYKIVEEGELISRFPQKYPVDREEVSHMIGYLAEKKYVDVRYAEEGVYCLCPLPEGRLYAEERLRERTNSVRSRLGAAFLAFLAAFLGAFLGAAVWALLLLGRAA